MVSLAIVGLARVFLSQNDGSGSTVVQPPQQRSKLAFNKTRKALATAGPRGFDEVLASLNCRHSTDDERLEEETLLRHTTAF